MYMYMLYIYLASNKGCCSCLSLLGRACQRPFVHSPDAQLWLFGDWKAKVHQHRPRVSEVNPIHREGKWFKLDLVGGDVSKLRLFSSMLHSIFIMRLMRLLGLLGENQPCQRAAISLCIGIAAAI